MGYDDPSSVQQGIFYFAASQSPSKYRKILNVVAQTGLSTTLVGF